MLPVLIIISYTLEQNIGVMQRRISFTLINSELRLFHTMSDKRLAGVEAVTSGPNLLTIKPGFQFHHLMTTEGYDVAHALGLAYESYTSFEIG